MSLKVKLLSDHFQRINLSIWVPGTNLAVDEIMARFEGRSKHATTIPKKPTPTGFKVWGIAQRGFLLVWNFHTPGTKGGPLDVKCPVELGGNAKTGKGGNKTQAVALNMLKRLPKRRYHLWMDNLFTSTRFLELLREEGYGASGTCRTNSGVLEELIQWKQSDINDTVPWGTTKVLATANKKVCQISWKDNALALMMSTVLDGEDIIPRLRKRPKETSSKSKTAQKPFKGLAQKVLDIPVVFDEYNHNMGAVDEHDNMASRNAGLRPIRRGGHQALEHWLLRVTLVNTYLVCLVGGEEGVKRNINFRSQKDFREQLAEALFYRGQKGPITPKRRVSKISIDSESLPPKEHVLELRERRQQCVCCAGMRIGDRPPKRVALGQISSNSQRQKRRTDTNQYCIQCDIAICKKYRCWDLFHGL